MSEESVASGSPGTPAPKPPRWQKSVAGIGFGLDEGNLHRLCELPGFAGRDEDAVAEEFLASKAKRWSEALAPYPEGTELRVLVDSISRQAFLVEGRTIVFIESF